MFNPKKDPVILSPNKNHPPENLHEPGLVSLHVLTVHIYIYIDYRGSK